MKAGTKVMVKWPAGNVEAAKIMKVKKYMLRCLLATCQSSTTKTGQNCLLRSAQ